MLLIRHYQKEQIYDILISIFHFINCNSFIVIFTMCVCVCRSLLVHSFKYGQYSTWILYMHPLLRLYIESSFIILYIYNILFVFFFKIPLSIIATCDNDVRNMICHLWVGTRQYSIFIFP